MQKFVKDFLPTQQLQLATDANQNYDCDHGPDEA